MKAPIDLFGQVPISRLEVKKKCKVMTGSADDVVMEVMLQKIAEASGLVYQLSNYKKIRRAAMEEEMTSRLSQAETFYGSLCLKTSEYNKRLRELKAAAGRSFESPTELKIKATRHQKLVDAQERAWEIIAMAKSTKKLTITQIRQLHILKIDTSIIPWHLASDRAKKIGSELGIFTEISLNNVLSKRFDDY